LIVGWGYQRGNRKSSIEVGLTMQWPKGKSIIYKALQRKSKN